MSKLLLDLKHGDHDAAQVLWDRTVERIAAAARKRLTALGIRAVDEDDVAVDVFASLCRGAGQGRFPRLEDRNDLWQVLMMLTRQKVVDQRRRQQPEWTESALAPALTDDTEARAIDLVQGDEPHPDVVVTAVDELERLLSALDQERRTISLLKLEGYSHGEIAQRLGISLRSVERKVALIKKKWTGLTDPPPY
ncbi:MAG: ECF-type sigma factor [Pirellulaceae bacterium]|nr:ECF-type sigma factor [Pirellulaceae bacterium]